MQVFFIFYHQFFRKNIRVIQEETPCVRKPFSLLSKILQSGVCARQKNARHRPQFVITVDPEPACSTFIAYPPSAIQTLLFSAAHDYKQLRDQDSVAFNLPVNLQDQIHTQGDRT